MKAPRKLYDKKMVCPFCGFAFTDKLNNPVYEEDIPKLLDYFKNVKNFSQYIGPRTVQDAILISKQALLIANLMDEPHTLRGAQYLKTTWLYRELGDRENEAQYLKLSKKHLEEAFVSENDAAKYYEKLFKCSTTPVYMKQRAQNNWLEFNGKY